jgi:hypothetical protein
MVVHPCRNGAECQDVTSNAQGYECICPLGFSGKDCDNLVTVWNAMLPNLVPGPCSKGAADAGGGNSSLVTARGSDQPIKLCSVVSTWKFAISILSACLSVMISLLAYLRLFSKQPQISRRVSIVPWTCTVASTIALVVLLVDDQRIWHHGNPITTPGSVEWPILLGFTGLTFCSEVGVAAIWRRRRQSCWRVESTVGNRMWRGVVVPLLAVLSASPSAAIFLALAKHNITDSHLSIGTVEWVVVHGWLVFSF